MAKPLEIMRQKNCGMVPVIGEKDSLVGMITDRDICLGFAANDKVAQIKVEELMTTKVIYCIADDKIENALKKMRKNQLKRLPVTGKNGKLVGILSITDILLSVRKNKKLKKKIYKTFKAIFQPRPIILRRNFRMNFNKMKTLFILRHAKSNWDNFGLADFDRPLNERGLKPRR